MLGIDGFNFRFWKMGFCEKTWNDYDIEAFWLILWKALSPIFVVICELNMIGIWMEWWWWTKDYIHNHDIKKHTYSMPSPPSKPKRWISQLHNIMINTTFNCIIRIFFVNLQNKTWAKELEFTNCNLGLWHL
jgi:hypothetical protein